jgi:hypothetical protein
MNPMRHLLRCADRCAVPRAGSSSRRGIPATFQENHCRKGRALRTLSRLQLDPVAPLHEGRRQLFRRRQACAWQAPSSAALHNDGRIYPEFQKYELKPTHGGRGW